MQKMCSWNSVPTSKRIHCTPLCALTLSWTNFKTTVCARTTHCNHLFHLIASPKSCIQDPTFLLFWIYFTSTSLCIAQATFIGVLPNDQTNLEPPPIVKFPSVLLVKELKRIFMHQKMHNLGTTCKVIFPRFIGGCFNCRYSRQPISNHVR